MNLSLICGFRRYDFPAPYPPIQLLQVVMKQKPRANESYTAIQEKVTKITHVSSSIRTTTTLNTTGKQRSMVIEGGCVHVWRCLSRWITDDYSSLAATVMSMKKSRLTLQQEEHHRRSRQSPHQCRWGQQEPRCSFRHRTRSVRAHYRTCSLASAPFRSTPLRCR